MAYSVQLLASTAKFQVVQGLTQFDWGSLNQKTIYSTHHTPPKIYIAQVRCSFAAKPVSSVSFEEVGAASV